MAEKVDTVLFRYKLDKQTQAELESGLAHLRASLSDATRAAQSGGMEAASGLRAMREELNKTESVGRRGLNMLKAYREEQERLAKSAKGVSLQRVESLTQSGARALSGLGFGAAGGALGGVSDLLQLRNTVEDLGATAGKANQGIGAMIGGLAPIAGPGALVIAGVTAGLGLLMKSLQDSKKAAEEAAKEATEELKARVELRVFEKTGNLAGAEGKLAQQREESIRLTETAAEYEAEFGDNMGVLSLAMQIAAGAARDHAKEIDDNATKTQVVVDELKAQKQAQAEVTEGLQGFIEGLGRAREATAKVIGKVEEWTAAQLKAQQEQQGELISLTKKYNDDIAKLEETTNQQRAAAAQKYNDSLVDLAEKAAESAENALAKLQEERAKLTTDLQREEADATIKAQREEVKALRDHERALKKIRADAAEGELKMTADRDFQALYFSRRETAKRLNEENENFTQGRQDQQEALTQERADRLVHYQQALLDAQVNYNKELNQIQVNANKQRQKLLESFNQQQADLNASLTQQLNTKRQGYLSELQMAAMTADERLKIQQETDAALLAQARLTLAAIQTGNFLSGLGNTFGQIGSIFNQSKTTNLSATVNAPITTGASPAQVGAVPSAIQSVVISTLKSLLPGI